MSGDDLIIRAVRAHPLRAVLSGTLTTGAEAWNAIEIVVIEVETASGLVGIGECLGRRGAAGYARFIEAALAPVLIGLSAHDRLALWAALRRQLSGRTGGMLIEAIAGIDIALWDLAGQAAGQPIWRLLGGVGRARVPAYASSINWTDDAAVEREVADALARGFTQIKVKIGQPVVRAAARAKQVRRLVGDGVQLGADANWAYDADDALLVGRALADENYWFFEEPIRPGDHAGYRRLSQHLPIRLAAGESDFCAADSAGLVADHTLGLIQPDIARSGGFTETWRIAGHAALHHVAYAPHVGWSGGVCAAASLHMAAAAENFLTFECMTVENPLRSALTDPVLGDVSNLQGGLLDVPAAPGLGVRLTPDALEKFLIRD
jgi:L-alanine-DL-glutamate epimerase-like enolase superfamily enzyme